MTRFGLVVPAVLWLGCLLSLSTLALAQKPARVGIHDACDPATFNAAIGPGTCIPGHHGTTNFNLFVGELTTEHIAGAWRFNPLLDASAGTFHLVDLDLSAGRATALQNTGGETHTFTRVASFGGGFVAFLNSLSGNPVPAPECAQVLPDGSLVPQPESSTNIFVEAGTTESGPTAGTDALPTGVSHWECCVHPWMRMTVVVDQ
jgi:hypothetical protein